MSLPVVFLKSAEQDLQGLKAYVVKRFGGAAWQASYAGIKGAVRNIEDFPLAGTFPEELERLHVTQYRQVRAGMNRIIYEIRREAVYVHIVCDVRRDMTGLLARRLLVGM